MTKQRKPSYLDFDKRSYPWKAGIDYRESPEAYQVGKGEQGVLICEPYKTEIGKHWRFKTPAIAIESSEVIFKLFQEYLDKSDFVGADMARKFLQMGYTRARRYANYKGGKKYDKDNDYTQLERGTGEAAKAESAAIFYTKWKATEANDTYTRMTPHCNYPCLYLYKNVNMRKITVCTFMTMDGVIQSPGSPEEDTSNNFKWGGWSAHFWDEVMNKAMTKTTSNPYDLLLGRRAYNMFENQT